MGIFERKDYFLVSSCIYPKHSSQQIEEEELLNGVLKKQTNIMQLQKFCDQTF